eukprot:1139284-Pelagomonas_calceolata.AAC.3
MYRGRVAILPQQPVLQLLQPLIDCILAYNLNRTPWVAVLPHQPVSQVLQPPVNCGLPDVQNRTHLARVAVLS